MRKHASATVSYDQAIANGFSYLNKEWHQLRVHDS